jgi:hypothetical protein
MSDLLITIGDSFTYGEGLQFHLWKEKYTNSFNRFKGKDRYEPCQTVSETFSEFYEYRMANNYSGVLGKLMGISRVSNFGNGGSNYGALETMDIWLDYLNFEKGITPKLCVFQFTNVTRDIGHVQGKYRDSSGGVFGAELYEDIKYTIARLNPTHTPGKSDIAKMNPILVKVFNVMLLEVKKRFTILEEKYGCKCIFLLGSTEEHSRKLVYDVVKDDEHYLPTIYNDTPYEDWDVMNKECGLTLRENIEVNDGHPCLESHHWLANQLYKKYLEISK